MDKTAEEVLPGPRVDIETIRELMSRVTYLTVVPEGTTSTFVHAYLDGRFYLATGSSACVSPGNFDAQIGVSIAHPKAVSGARDKLWELEGYRLFRGDIQTISVATEASRPLELGDQVRYYEQIDGQTTAPMVAIVTAILDDDQVSLTVLAPNGTSHARDKVALVPSWKEPPPSLMAFARTKP